ncbi:MAG: hypothetical protein KDN19_00135 [Verrucomicrobiae bacterium]|nr:hypothetical protein [Verrucomicrobiae bacterium]
MNAILRFFFPQMLGRASYFIRLILANLATAILYFGIEDAEHKEEAGFLVGVLLLAMILLTIYAAIYIILPRIREIGLSGWTLILAFIPVVAGFFGMSLLFVSGSRLGKFGSFESESTEVPEDDGPADQDSAALE